MEYLKDYREGYESGHEDGCAETLAHFVGGNATAILDAMPSWRWADFVRDLVAEAQRRGVRL